MTIDSVAAVRRARRLRHKLGFPPTDPPRAHTSALARTLSGHAETVGRRLGFFDHAGQEVAPQRCVVCCIPFFVYDVALGDEVEINANSVLQRVVRSSGQVTFRVWFGGQDAAKRQALAREMEAMKPLMEWSSDNLLALSSSEAEAQRLADYLQSREKEGLLQYETGRS